jgi:hypothetical protein
MCLTPLCIVASTTLIWKHAAVGLKVSTMASRSANAVAREDMCSRSAVLTETEGGNFGIGVLPDVASADGHGKRGGDEGVDDGTADVTGCLRGRCHVYTVFSIGARGSLGKSTYAQDKHKGLSWEHNYTVDQGVY